MAETLQLRLVRCPKCENLLQEHPDYSIYQCGGCGAILRAKRGKLDGNKESERFDEKRVGVVSDKSDNVSEKSENVQGKSPVSDAENAENKVIQNIGNDSNSRRVANCVVEDENSSKTHVGNGKMDYRVGKLERQIGNSNGLSRSSRFLESKLSDRKMEERFRRMRTDYFEKGRFSSSNKFDDDSSSRFNFDSGYANPPSRSAKPEYFDHDREELLRKLDELKDQLIRYQTVNGKAEYHGEHGGYFLDRPSSFHRASSHCSASNNHIARPPYVDPYHEPFPTINNSSVGPHDYPNSIHTSNHAPRFEDPFEPQKFARLHPQRVPSHLHHGCMSVEPGPFEPSCACYQCYTREQAFSKRRFSCDPPMGSHGYDPRKVNDNPHSHRRKPSDINVEVGAFPRAHPTRVILSKEHGCHPIAGGAPFVTCHNCFKLLKLPKKVFGNKGEWRMSCGACFSVVSFGIVDGKLVSLDTFTSYSTTEDLDSSNNVGNNDHGGSYTKVHNASFCSEDYANSVYDIQAMDKERISSSSCQDVISPGKYEEMHNVSTTTTEEEHFSDEPCEKEADFPPKKDLFDYTLKHRGVNRGEKGSLSSRVNQERIVTNKSTLRHYSLKQSLATEMEIPFDDYGGPEVSQDSGDTYRENDRSKGKKGADSFLAGIIKKSFRDLSRPPNQSAESGKRNVTVNGHLIPDRLIKKAEKLAGPIHPGKYWYDYRAGFWGVIGGPCLGIIPPHIQEFNYPMPVNCAGGNTGVFVNGRELHPKDLDLLASRGLPDTKDRSYTVELSGRVVDKATGNYVVNLGKLAPTVEKLKCGFGMRAPEQDAA